MGHKSGGKNLAQKLEKHLDIPFLMWYYILCVAAKVALANL